MSSLQWIDSRKFLTCRGAAIASGIFELFGQFSGKSGNEVREDLLVWISEKKTEVQTCVKIVLDHKGYNLSYWMTRMSRIQTPADDIVIYCLARMYKRCIIIHTSRFPWSTLSRQCKMNVEEIMACSDIKLLLLGNGKFAEIRNIRTPTLPGTWPCQTHNTRNGTTPHIEATTNKRKKTKTTCRDGRKPGSSIITRQAIKSISETPAHSPEQLLHNKPHHERISTRPLCDNRLDIDYSALNDGYDIKTRRRTRTRRRHPSRPQNEPTVPRQAAQKRIEETKIHLSSQYNNLDLEKIMESQYPALQLALISGLTNGVIDRTNPSVEEYITPVLGTLMGHGVTESKPDPNNTNLENTAPTDNLPPYIKPENKLQSTPSLSNEVTKPPTQDNMYPLMSSESSELDNINGVTDGPVQTAPFTTPQMKNNDSDELHGVTNTVPVEPDCNTVQQTTAQSSDASKNVLLNEVTNTPELRVSSEDNTGELNGVTNNSTMQLTNELKMRNTDVNGVMENATQTSDREVNDAVLIEAETLPDLVLTNNMTLNEANTTEDEDEAAEALLQLSKLDTIPDDDPELPLGVLPMDAAPVPITLGNQDVLNAIENFKQTNGETGVTTDNSDNKNVPDDLKKDHNEKENKNKNKKDKSEMSEHQSAPEPSPPTSPTKGSLVLVKHGI